MGPFGRGQMILVRYADDNEAAEDQGAPAAKRARAAAAPPPPPRTLWAGSDGRGDGCAMGW